MSYIETMLGGKSRGLKFNQMAVVTITKYLDFENIEATYGYALVYSGLVANSYVKREENTFTFEEVCDWADELTIEDITKIRDVFEQTQSFKNLIKTAQEPLTKKKPKSNKDKV